MNNPTKVSTAAPANDGDVNLYESPEAGLKAWFDRKRRVLFVNGMDNTPINHAESAQALSMLQACPVIGVYNKTDGFWTDVGQCLQDKATLGKSITLKIGAGLEFAAWDIACEALYQQARKTIPMLAKGEFVASLINANKATLALYRLLRLPELAGVPIFAHSQGNLIASNALTAVALADGKDAIKGRVVNSFGSPCRFWPPGIVRSNSLFTFDPVGWLDYGFDLSSIKVGAAGHAFDLYMKSDPDFVINRFRTGGWGMTLNLDEKGLAGALVEMGNNPDRVYNVFAKLEQSYWSDRDEVALFYVETMKASRPQDLRSMVQAKKGLSEVLVNCLTGGVIGWDTKAETKAAEWVASLK